MQHWRSSHMSLVRILAAEESFSSTYPWDIVFQGHWGTGPDWGWCSFQSWVEEAPPSLMKSTMKHSLQSTRIMRVAGIKVRVRRLRDNECRATGSCRWGREPAVDGVWTSMPSPRHPPEPQPESPWTAPSGGCPPATRMGGSAIPCQ